MAEDFVESLVDHADVFYQNMQFQPSASEEPKNCDDPVSWGYFVHGSLIPAGLIILILAHMQRRMKPITADDCCHRYWALIYPLNLLDDCDNRLPYSLAFGATASLCLDLFFGTYAQYFAASAPQEWLKNNCENRAAYSLAFGAAASLMLDLFYGTYSQYYAANVDQQWIKILIGGLATIEIGLSCYPYFACISTPSRLTGSILGFLYVSFWFSVQMTLNITCPDRPGTFFRYQSLVAQFPVLICMFLLAMYFLFTFCYTIKLRRQNIKPTMEEKMMSTHHAIYVKELFEKPVKKVYTGWEAKVYKRYMPKAGFKYPTRICAAFVVAVICMYQLALPMIAGGRTAFEGLFQGIKYGAPNYLASLNYTQEQIDNTMKIIDQTEIAADISLVLGSCTAIVLQLLYVGHIFICYRKHVLRLYRGDRLFLPKDAITSQDAIVGNLKYCGYQIAYFLSGYIIITYVLFALVFLLATVIVMPLINNAGLVFFVILNFLLPAGVIGAIVFGSQIILAQVYFLQPKLNEGDKQKPIALQHRQWYHNFSYFLVFLNTLLGLVSAFVRIITGILYGLFLLSRIDRPVLMRGYEIKDNAYKVYVGNLNMINQHGHPVLIVFCQMLINEYILPGRVKKYTSRRPGEGYGAMDKSPSHVSPEARKKKAAMFRWHIAYTLLNNPSIIGTRKRVRSLSFAETRKRIREIATSSDPDMLVHQQILMPHAQQLMIRTQNRKGDVVAPEGVTLDDLEIRGSTPTTPITSTTPATTPNSTKLETLPLFTVDTVEQGENQSVEETADEINDTAELIDETTESDRSSPTPLQPVV